LEQAYIELFGVFASLAMPEAVYLRAAQLCARFALRTPDALHLACARNTIAARLCGQMTTDWRKHRAGLRSTS